MHNVIYTSHKAMNWVIHATRSLVVIGLGNGLAPVPQQTTICTNADLFTGRASVKSESNTILFFQVNTFENAVSENLVVLFRPQSVGGLLAAHQTFIKSALLIYHRYEPSNIFIMN